MITTLGLPDFSVSALPDDRLGDPAGLDGSFALLLGLLQQMPPAQTTPMASVVLPEVAPEPPVEPASPTETASSPSPPQTTAQTLVSPSFASVVMAPQLRALPTEIAEVPIVPARKASAKALPADLASTPPLPDQSLGPASAAGPGDAALVLAMASPALAVRNPHAAEPAPAQITLGATQTPVPPRIAALPQVVEVGDTAPFPVSETAVTTVTELTASPQVEVRTAGAALTPLPAAPASRKAAEVPQPEALPEPPLPQREMFAEFTPIIARQSVSPVLPVAARPSEMPPGKPATAPDLSPAVASVPAPVESALPPDRPAVVAPAAAPPPVSTRTPPMIPQSPTPVALGPTAPGPATLPDITPAPGQRFVRSTEHVETPALAQAAVAAEPRPRERLASGHREPARFETSAQAPVAVASASQPEAAAAQPEAVVDAREASIPRATVTGQTGEVVRRLRLELSPPLVGHVLLDLRHEGGTVTAHAIVDQRATGQVLRHVEAQVQRALEEQGLKMGAFDVSCRDDGQRGDREAPARFTLPPLARELPSEPERLPRYAAPPRSADGAIDLYV